MWLVSPLSWLLIAVALACAAIRLARLRRGLLTAAAVIAAASIFAMTPLLANLLLGRLESGYAVPRDCTILQPDTAIVLAGGISAPASDADDDSVLQLASRRRVDRAVAWWRAGSGRHLVMSGGSSSGGKVPESTLMSSYAQRFGVPAMAMSGESASLTTWDSAQRLARLMPRLPRRVVLVTSAAHMPRAQYAMAAAGFETCPVATDRRYLPPQWPGYLIPQRSALEKSDQGLHEVVGLLYYRWLAFRSRQQAGEGDSGDR